MVVSIYANTYHSSWQKQVMFLNSTIFYLKLEEVYLLSTFSISSTLNIMLIVNVYTIALALHWYFMYKKQNFHLPFTVLLKGRLNFEKSSMVCYIFLETIFCPKKEKIIWKIFGWEKHPLTTISFEISILEKNYRK